jgi:prepilin-type N-terminal cleavage/methylation domain-containing protein
MKNNKGLTLIEVLSTLVILSIIMILTFNLISRTSAESNKQSKDNQELRSISYVLKLVTKDVRQSVNSIDSSIDEFKLVNAYSSTNDVTYSYDPTTLTLRRNNQIVSTNIRSFDTTHSPTFIKIYIENDKQESVTTTLYYRKE